MVRTIALRFLWVIDLPERSETSHQQGIPHIPQILTYILSKYNTERMKPVCVFHTICIELVQKSDLSEQPEGSLA